MKKIILYLLVIPVFARAQKIPDYGFDKIRLTTGDQTIQAELKPAAHVPDPRPDRTYFWYAGNSIQHTQGGHSGRLLNGLYTELYPNKNLKEEGLFSLGLKNGEWKDWTADGTLTQLLTWKKGQRSGKFSLYDEHGKLKQSGCYTENLLEGTVTSYDEKGAQTKTTYHKGSIVTGKKPPFWKRILPFKKNT